jgi:hypothetical protein
MTSSQIFEFSRSGERAWQLSLPANASSAAVIRGPRGPKTGGHAVVLTRTAVQTGDRVDVVMQLSSGRRVVAKGVVKGVLAEPGAGALRVEIVFAHSHTLRVRAMLDAVGTIRQFAPTVVEDVVRLRVRGTRAMLDGMKGPGGGVGGTFEVPWRRELSMDQRLLLEIGLGPFVDEILVVGRIIGRTVMANGRRTTAVPDSRGTLPTQAVVEIDEAHAERVRYVMSVAAGHRPATSRSVRRYPLEIPGRWWVGARVEQQTFADISRSGAFVGTRTPPHLGSLVTMELTNSVLGRIRVGGEVRWVSEDPRRPGFGASFRRKDRQAVDQLSAWIDEESASLPVWA